MTITISASILAANVACLGQEASDALAAGADWIHLDIMDNHYVPNLSFGPDLCRAMRNFGIQSPIDVHLMTSPVDSLIAPFAAAGANYISFHPDATTRLDRTIQLILDHGCKPGLAFNPGTPLDYLNSTIDKLDLILIMAVNPGFAGQKFIPATLHKIQQAANIITSAGKTQLKLQVDGGIDNTNINAARQNGANNFVVGSHIFNSSNYAATIAALHSI